MPKDSFSFSVLEKRSSVLWDNFVRDCCWSKMSSQVMGISKKDNADSLNSPFKADGCKQRAEEDAGIRVAFSGEQRQPTGTLLSSLSWRFMSQQVGHPHGSVTDVLAQGHGWWDGEAARGAPGFPKSTFSSRKHGPESCSGLRSSPLVTIRVCCVSKPSFSALRRAQLLPSPWFKLTLTLHSLLYFCPWPVTSQCSCEALPCEQK